MYRLRKRPIAGSRNLFQQTPRRKLTERVNRELSEQPIEFGHRTPPAQSDRSDREWKGAPTDAAFVTLGDPSTFVQIPESFYQLHIAKTFRQTPFCDSTNESFCFQMSYRSRISENMSQIPQKESENVTKWQRLNNREHSPAPLSERQQLCDALLPKGKVKRPPPCNEGVAVRNLELGTTDRMSTCTWGPLFNDVCKIC